MNLLAGPILLSVLAAMTSSRPLAQTSTDTTALTVATYNIRHGSGLDGVLDLGRTAAAIRHLGADIVALEEVDNGASRTGGVDQAAELGRILGMHHAFGSFMSFQGGEYGMALLSRFPIVSSQSIRLPDGKEPRVSLAATIALPGRDTLTAFVVHFDWIGSDSSRFRQAQVVADTFSATAGPRIVLGDFNDSTGSRTLDLFHRIATEASKPTNRRSTFPAGRPDREIDFIFLAPSGRWAEARSRVGVGAAASDHRPVVAHLNLLKRVSRPR